MTVNDYKADLPLSTLSGMIRQGEIISTALVRVCLDRIQRYDGREGINCYITVVADLALQQADEADKLLRKGKFRGPLHGLPFAINDNIETRGIGTTGVPGFSHPGCPRMRPTLCTS